MVVDEVQKVPALLEEIHWLIEDSATRFVLCGSSARKLRRESHNLLGGRAVDHHLLPPTSREIGEADLLRMLRHGALPIHYLVDDPRPLLWAYVNNYMKAEVIDESATRNIQAFARFLQMAGLAHGQQIDFASIARECGVAGSAVRSYYQILHDTMLGFTLEPWRHSKKRRLVEAATFYFFDVGVASQIHPEVQSVDEGTDASGRTFEHFLLNEVRAVDLKAMRALQEEFGPRRKLVVSRVVSPRRTEDGIEILPWDQFCRELWAGAGPLAAELDQPRRRLLDAPHPLPNAIGR